MKYLTFCIIFLSGFIINSCKEKKENKTEAIIQKKQYLPEKNSVNVTVLTKSSFKKEILSNGKLVALRKVPLKFDVSEKLSKIYVKNGSYVKKGQVLAELRKFSLQQANDKAKIFLKRSMLDFQDKLISRGYDFLNKDSIPAKEYEMIAIRSGYKEALHELKNTERKLKDTKMIAPFSGKIASVEVKPYQQIDTGKEVMTLINDEIFEVKFNLIESELADVKVNSKVEIKPFALNKTYHGHVSTINPRVEKDGTILITARVENDKDLIEGMNVKVLIKKNVTNQFVVPKSSVVIRQNQEVLFRVKSGKTLWTYVQTTDENSTHYSIISHPNKTSDPLKVGDSIVISNNLNLAHNIEVTIKK